MSFDWAWFLLAGLVWLLIFIFLILLLSGGPVGVPGPKGPDDLPHDDLPPHRKKRRD